MKAIDGKKLAERFKIHTGVTNKTVSLYLPEDLLGRLDAVCEKIEMPRNAVITSLLREKVAEMETWLANGDQS